MRKKIKLLPTACPECKEEFKGLVGRNTHMRKAHKLNPDGTRYIEPKAEIVKAKRQYIKKGTVSHGHSQAPTDLYIYIGAKLEEIIHAVAYKHELVEKHLAAGFFEYIRST